MLQSHRTCARVLCTGPPLPLFGGIIPNLTFNFQWKGVAGYETCPNICESIGGNWRKDTLAAIERHESGVGQHAQLMNAASAKLAEMRSQRSQKQAELESHQVLRLAAFHH